MSRTWKLSNVWAARHVSASRRCEGRFPWVRMTTANGETAVEPVAAWLGSACFSVSESYGMNARMNWIVSPC